MTELLDDWLKFCSGEQNFTKYHFTTLLQGNLDDFFLEEVFQSFEEKNDLISRVKSYIDRNKDGKGTDPNEIQNYLIKDFKERRNTLLKFDGLVEQIEDFKFEYIPEKEKVQALKFDDVWSQEFHDSVDFDFKELNAVTLAIYEAFYGMTNDFEYRLYLITPLLNNIYTAQDLFEFKRLGGVYAVQNNVVYYSF